MDRAPHQAELTLAPRLTSHQPPATSHQPPATATGNRADGRRSPLEVRSKPDHVAAASDYVGEAGGALSPSGHLEAPPISNPHGAHAYQHPVGSIVSHLLDAGFVLEALREWPYANGCRLHPGLVRAEGQRFTTPPAVPNLPLMLGLAARRPQEAG